MSIGPHQHLRVSLSPLLGPYSRPEWRRPPQENPTATDLAASTAASRVVAALLLRPEPCQAILSHQKSRVSRGLPLRLRRTPKLPTSRSKRFSSDFPLTLQALCDCHNRTRHEKSISCKVESRPSRTIVSGGSPGAPLSVHETRPSPPGSQRRSPAALGDSEENRTNLREIPRLEVVEGLRRDLRDRATIVATFRTTQARSTWITRYPNRNDSTLIRTHPHSTASNTARPPRLRLPAPPLTKPMIFLGFLFGCSKDCSELRAWVARRRGWARRDDGRLGLADRQRERLGGCGRGFGDRDVELGDAGSEASRHSVSKMQACQGEGQRTRESSPLAQEPRDSRCLDRAATITAIRRSRGSVALGLGPRFFGVGVSSWPCSRAFRHSVRCDEHRASRRSRAPRLH